MEGEENFTICDMDEIGVVLGLTFRPIGEFKGEKRELVVEIDGKDVVLPLVTCSGRSEDVVTSSRQRSRVECATCW